MEFLSIQSFKYGLDGRRSDMTSQPGVLSVLQNGRVNSGGEIEKRKAFVKSTNTFPANTYGLEATSAGLITFGSDAAPSGALPVGVTYVRLQHPTVVDGGVYNAGRHLMTAIAFSCNFNGNAFVGATFADGRTFLYFNGIIIDHSRNGLVFTDTLSLASLSSALARQINLLPGWLAGANQDQFGNALNGSTIIKSPIGDYFTPVFSVNSASGLLSFRQIDRDVASVAVVGSSASFRVINGTAGVDTFSLNYGAQPLVTVTCASTAAATAVAITNAINAGTAIQGTVGQGVTALTDGVDVVTVFAPLNVNGVTLNVVTTGTADSAAAVSPPSLVISFSPSNIFLTNNLTAGRRWFPSASASASTTGGIAPYTYTWVEKTSPASGITINAPGTGSVCTFGVGSTGLVAPIKVNGLFTCTVKDKNGNSASSTFSVTFNLLSH